MIKTQGELDQSRRQGNINRSQHPQHNVDYLLAKIKALEEALSAVGDELSDSKNNEVSSEVVQSRIVPSVTENSDYQKKLEEWASK